MTRVVSVRCTRTFSTGPTTYEIKLRRVVDKFTSRAIDVYIPAELTDESVARFAAELGGALRFLDGDDEAG